MMWERYSFQFIAQARVPALFEFGLVMKQTVSWAVCKQCQIALKNIISSGRGMLIEKVVGFMLFFFALYTKSKLHLFQEQQSHTHTHRRTFICVLLFFCFCNFFHSITEYITTARIKQVSQLRFQQQRPLLMTFIKLEELRARQRLNYDSFVIKHHLDKLLRPIEEYNKNVCHVSTLSKATPTSAIY